MYEYVIAWLLYAYSNTTFNGADDDDNDGGDGGGGGGGPGALNTRTPFL